MQPPHQENQPTSQEATRLDDAPIRQSILARILRGPQPTPTVAHESTDPHEFADTDEGSGVFGRWTCDADGLPAYVYEMNHRRDPRAYYLNSQGIDRRDHWHQIGNDRVTGLASNDGVVQLYLADRGGIILNRFAPAFGDRPNTFLGYFDLVVRFIVRVIGIIRVFFIRLRAEDVIVPRGASLEKPQVQRDLDDQTQFAFSGGYSYLDDGEQTWATAYRFAPEVEGRKRVFGMGYYATEITHRNIQHKRRIYAPYGDDPLLISEVELTNLGEQPVDVRCYEYWDVNLHQMRVQWIRSGLAASVGDTSRVRINSRFQPIIEPDPDGQTLRFRQRRFLSLASAELPVEEQEGFVDSTPPGVFLSNLSEQPVSDYYIDKVDFFGRGTARVPETVRLRKKGKTDRSKRGDSMPYCMVFRHDLRLEPNKPVRLRYAYGALPHPDIQVDFAQKYRARQDTFKATLEAWKKQIVYFWTGQDRVLHREMAWHAYYLLSATLYSEFYKTHYTPQGSAYLYLHGADGAPRDQALFTVPLVYIRPDLARQMLRLLMGLRNVETCAMPYSFVGNGAHDDALDLHQAPSDLDLFFMLAVAEYLAATGDAAYLQQRFPVYRAGRPPAPGDEITVLEHIELAAKHLIDMVGTNPDGLISIGTGDWDDGIVIKPFLSRLPKLDKPWIARERTRTGGASVPNSQMALYVLPLLAALIEQSAPALAARLRAHAEALTEPVKKQWDANKRWFYRAYLVNANGSRETIGDGRVSLQAQIWPLISGLAAEMGIEAQLIETIDKKLDEPSRTGPMLEEDGEVWPAVTQLLTWGYCRSRPDLAWRALNRQTYAKHATIFPHIWFNIWTGPDGTNSERMKSYPGGTWSSEVTPMTDAPALNVNQDGMALFGLIRVCGVEPSRDGSGLDIAPKGKPERFILETELIKLDVAPGRIAGEYRAAVDGALTLHVYVPGTPTRILATLDGKLWPVTAGSRVDFPLSFRAGEVFAFEVLYG